jgi:hypothetical protein
LQKLSAAPIHRDTLGFLANHERIIASGSLKISGTALSGRCG